MAIWEVLPWDDIVTGVFDLLGGLLGSGHHADERDAQFALLVRQQNVLFKELENTMQYMMVFMFIVLVLAVWDKIS